jgi:hypothetical protein
VLLGDAADAPQRAALGEVTTTAAAIGAQHELGAHEVRDHRHLVQLGKVAAATRRSPRARRPTKQRWVIPFDEFIGPDEPDDEARREPG